MTKTDDKKKTHIGHILWTDLTVDDASGVREFYAAVVGWKSVPVEMGDYEDYMMEAPDAPPTPSGPPYHTVGICHARGANKDLPAQWLNYFGVADLDHSRNEVTRLGGKLLSEIRAFGPGRYCMIQDPAGAACALFEEGDEA